MSCRLYLLLVLHFSFPWHAAWRQPFAITKAVVFLSPFCQLSLENQESDEKYSFHYPVLALPSFCLTANPQIFHMGLLSISEMSPFCRQWFKRAGCMQWHSGRQWQAGKWTVRTGSMHLVWVSSFIYVNFDSCFCAFNLSVNKATDKTHSPDVTPYCQSDTQQFKSQQWPMLHFFACLLFKKRTKNSHKS